MSNNSGNLAVALLAGAAVGAGVGILFAPDKGTRTREKIKNNFDQAKHDLEHKIEKVQDQLKEKIMYKKYDLEDSYEALVSNVNNKKENLVSFLEDKLNNLKKSQAKV